MVYPVQEIECPQHCAANDLILGAVNTHGLFAVWIILCDIRRCIHLFPFGNAAEKAAFTGWEPIIGALSVPANHNIVCVLGSKKTKSVFYIRHRRDLLICVLIKRMRSDNGYCIVHGITSLFLCNILDYAIGNQMCAECGSNSENYHKKQRGRPSNVFGNITNN